MSRGPFAPALGAQDRRPDPRDAVPGGGSWVLRCRLLGSGGGLFGAGGVLLGDLVHLRDGGVDLLDALGLLLGLALAMPSIRSETS
jgi:hypothetical protein